MTYTEIMGPDEAEPVFMDDVREVSAVFLECKSTLLNAGLKPTTSELLEMTKIVLSMRWGWPKRTGSPWLP